MPTAMLIFALSFVCALLGFKILREWLIQPKKTNAPALGKTGPISSYITAFKSLRNSRKLIIDAYHQKKTYQLPALMGGNRVVVSKDLVDELRQTPVLSMSEASAEILQARYTIGQALVDNQIHVGLVSNQLNRNLGVLFPEIRDELVQSCEDEIRFGDDEWATVPAVEMIMRTVSRTSNRIFVGLPLCRNPEWRDLQISFTVSVVLDATIINFFPRFLWPLVGRYLTKSPGALKQATRLVSPLINERLNMPQEDRPNDFLTWLLDEAPKHPGAMELEALVRRMLLINFTGIHTTSIVASQALFDLASRPEYHQPLRTEVESVVQQYGWTKQAISHMKKLDSFVRESQRLNGITLTALTRKATDDYTFTDGTFIPRGTTVMAPMYGIHTDPDIYENPMTFDAFRFSKLPPAENVKFQMVSTSLEFLPWGHGKGACAGRFFVANELKCLLAHILTIYDVKTMDGARPTTQDFDVACLPDRKAKLMFRRRVL